MIYFRGSPVEQNIQFYPFNLHHLIARIEFLYAVEQGTGLICSFLVEDGRRGSEPDQSDQAGRMVEQSPLVLRTQPVDFLVDSYCLLEPPLVFVADP